MEEYKFKRCGARTISIKSILFKYECFSIAECFYQIKDGETKYCGLEKMMEEKE